MISQPRSVKSLLRQRGVAALLLVITIVAMCAIALTSMRYSNLINGKRTAALVSGDQSWWVARGVADWVVTLLERDRSENAVDHLGEFWAQPVDYLPVDNGFVSGQLYDLSGRFNLNNLAQGAAAAPGQAQPPPASGGANAPTVDTSPQAVFSRLIAQVTTDLSASGGFYDPQSIVNAVLDWVDADIEPRFPGGAEDDVYLSREPPYRAANQPFQSVTELRLIQGMTPELLQALQPLVTALPGVTDININTAPRPVLMALTDTPSPGDIDTFLETRIEQPAEAIDDVVQNARLGPAVDAAGLTVQSSYFLAEAEANVGTGRVKLYSLIHRDDRGDARIVSQSRDVY